MIKFRLTEKFKKRFENFLSSKLFSNQPTHAKTDYWKYHSKQIRYSLKKSLLTLEGKSGNYIPDKRSSYSSFIKSLKIFFKKLIGLNISNKLSYKIAFNKVMSGNNDSSYLKIKFDKKKIIAGNFTDINKIFPFDYEINDQIIKSYLHANILNSYIDLSERKYVAEIGAGNGNFLAILKHHFNTRCIIDIDLPETLVLCIPFLENLFPEARILLPNEIEKKISRDELSNYDFIFLTPGQLDLLDENIIDLFINTDSFGEMNMTQIKDYINLIQKVGKKHSYFFCCNRVEKNPNIKSDDTKSNILSSIKFCDYPFLNNEILFFEECKFYDLVQPNPVYLRLEQIKK